METFNPFLTASLHVTEAGYTEVGPSWSRLAAFFPYYRMYYITRGEAKMFIHGETLELTPGRIYFIPAFSVTGAKCPREMEHYWMHFNLDITAVSYLTIYKPALYAEAQPCDEELFDLVRKNFDAAEGGANAPSALACASLAKYLFSRFLPREKISSESANFIPVLEYIDTHLDSGISNTDLCNIMCLNKTYFTNVFTKQFGISPKQYVLQKRIGAAARMLVETDKTVKEIAFEFGYDNEMYFNRIFHKITGSAPGQYRKNFRGKDKL